MPTIVLLRHGDVPGLSPERFRGRAPLELTPLGLRQARAASAAVRARWHVGAIYASPLGRAVATARAIATPLGTTVDVDDALADIDYGAWQGRTHDEVRADDPDGYERWQRAPQLTQFPGGESLAAVQVRLAGFVAALARRHADGETVVVVGHDSSNRVLVLGALDLPLSHYRRVAQAPCAISVLTCDRFALGVVSLNETAHLHDLG